MTVNLTLSETSGGYSLPDTTDMGEVTPGAAAGHQDVFISHDAEVNSITNCTIYLTRYVGSNYQGSDEDTDFTQIMGWGDASGGVEMSMTPDSPWTTGNKFAAGWAYFKNGSGDINNQIPLDKDSIVVGSIPSSDGEIPVGGEAHIQIDVDVPAAPGSAGYKAFSMVFAYSATS
jgi:hypothetical protein